MKEGWEYKTLGEVSRFISDGDWIEKKDQSLSGIRLVQTGNIGIGEYKDKPNNAHFISEDTFKRLKCTEIFENDILISRLPEPIGRTCIIPKLKTRMITAVDCSIVRLKEDIILSEWFKYYTMSDKYFRQIKEESSGTTRQRITRKKLEKFNIPITTLDEQRRIVSYLDSSFKLIDEIKNKALKSLTEAKALFQSALAEAMEPKEGWEEKTFGEICTYHKEQKRENGYKYIGMENIESGTGNLIGYGATDNVLSSTFFFKKGEVLYGRLRPYLKKVYIAEFDGCCSTEIFPIKTNGVLSGLIKYWFLTDEITNKINDTSAGCRMPRGNMNEVLQFHLYIPSDKQSQMQIVSHLDKLSSKVRAIEEKYQKMVEECDALKQAMLRDVFE